MQVVLVTEGHGPARRLAELLRGEGLGARDGDLAEPPEPGLAHVATGSLESGFVWPAARLVVLAEADLAGTRTGTRQSHRMPSRAGAGSIRSSSRLATTSSTSSTVSAGTWR